MTREKSEGATALEAAIDARGLHAVSALLGTHSWIVAAWAGGSTRPKPQARTRIEKALGIDSVSWLAARERRSDSPGARQLRMIVGECGRGGAVTIARRIGASDSAVRSWTDATKAPTIEMRARLAAVYGIPVDAWPATTQQRPAVKRPTRDSQTHGRGLRRRIGQIVEYDADGPGESMIVRRGVLVSVVPPLVRSSAQHDDSIEKVKIRLSCGDVRDVADSRVRPESGEPSPAAIAWARECERGRNESRRAVLARVYAERAERERLERMERSFRARVGGA